jgi:hypothetical protein
LEKALCALAGDSSAEAWALREDAVKHAISPSSVLTSLAGVRDPKAADLRRHYYHEGGNCTALLVSLAGAVEPPEGVSLQHVLRTALDEARTNGEYFGALKAGAIALIGRSGEDADACRAMLSSHEVARRAVLRATFNPTDKEFWSAGGLASVGSLLFPLRLPVTSRNVAKRMQELILLSYSGDESDLAWNERRQFETRWGSKSALQVSLSGLETPRAWKLRRSLEQAGHGGLPESLLFIDSPTSHEIRMKHKSLPPSERAEGLAFLKSPEATKARELLWSETKDKSKLVGMYRNPFAIAVEAARSRRNITPEQSTGD